MVHRLLAGDKHVLTEEDEKNLLIARVVMIIVILLSGVFVFLPYTKCMKQKEADQE